ncbi:hypothetical protein [uncultured Mucilaginibacter sp.]|uniref:hypothetical protein n=1 Tax=uncultured Mucilaginibacter sp. TaxID=797541 RepID=UPI0025E5065D|nr:hypothetical protein [uncultured Mucilaginibacter sp.]
MNERILVSKAASTKSGQNNVGLCVGRGIEIFARSAGQCAQTRQKVFPIPIGMVLPACAVWPRAKEASLLT